VNGTAVKKRKKVATAFLGVGAAVGTTVFGTATPAMATATNGQIVTAWDYVTGETISVWVCGHNQNNNWVCTGHDHGINSGDGVLFPGWYWKGTIDVHYGYSVRGHHESTYASAYVDANCSNVSPYGSFASVFIPGGYTYQCRP
jgi:hypothetical protein